MGSPIELSEFGVKKAQVVVDLYCSMRLITRQIVSKMNS